MSGDRVFRRVWTRALLFVFHSWGHPHWVDERNKRRRRRRGKKGKKNTTGERRARLLQLQCTSQWWQTTMTMRTKTTMTLSLVRMDGHFDFSSLFTRVWWWFVPSPKFQVSLLTKNLPHLVGGEYSDIHIYDTLATRQIVALSILVKRCLYQIPRLSNARPKKYLS